MADKHGRVQAIIQKNLADIILYELKNPLTKFVSVNAVRITSDYSYGKVYVSDINPERTDEIVAFLNNNAKKIRAMLASKLDIYKTPELKFFADKTFEEQQAMNQLVEKAINSKPLTLKDVYGEDYHMVGEKPAKKATTEKGTKTKKTSTTRSTTTKKTSTKSTTAKKTTTHKKAADSEN